MGVVDLDTMEEAKIDSLQVGDIIYLDDDFTCTPPKKTTVCADEIGELYFICKAGRHYLNDGQHSDHGTYSGVFVCKPT